MDSEPYLVPGRTCGACTACCTELAIVEDSFRKMPGVPCAHCVIGQGCDIYETRPGLCRDYHCLWRSIPDLDERWRPDLSGIMVVPAEVPPGYPGPLAVSLVVIGAPEAVQTDDFAMMVGGFVDRGTATHLDVPGRAGMYGCSQLLNEALAPAVAARDLARVKAVIGAIYTALRAEPTCPITEEDLKASAKRAAGDPVEGA